MPKIFAYFCGGQTDAGGKPAMDFSKLLGFAKSTGKVCVSVFVCVCVRKKDEFLMISANLQYNKTWCRKYPGHGTKICERVGWNLFYSGFS